MCSKWFRHFIRPDTLSARSGCETLCQSINSPSAAVGWLADLDHPGQGRPGKTAENSRVPVMLGHVAEPLMLHADRCAKRFKFFAIVFAETRTRDSLKIPEKWGFSGAWDMPAPSNAWGKTLTSQRSDQ